MLLIDLYDCCHGSCRQRRLADEELAALVRRVFRPEVDVAFHSNAGGVTGIVPIRGGGYVSVTARTQFRRERGVIELRCGYGDDLGGDYGTRAAEAPHLSIHASFNSDDLADHFMRTMQEVAQRWSAGQPRASRSVRLVLNYP